MLHKKKPLHYTLAAKGWSHDEIQKTYDIMYDPKKQKKHIHHTQKAHTLLYWMMLLDLGVCNLLISLGLVPFLMVLGQKYVYPLVIVLGFGMGVFFNMLIWDLEYVETKHHFMAMIFVPAMAILNISIMVTIANSMAELIKSGQHENPLLLSIAYVVAFMFPYLQAVIRHELQKKKEDKLPPKRETHPHEPQANHPGYEQYQQFRREQGIE
jgi:hypothetical protein